MIAAKITPEHLKRSAYVYVRQSSLTQVQENLESQRRQYELASSGSEVDLVRLWMTHHQVYLMGFIAPRFRYSSGTRLPT